MAESATPPIPKPRRSTPSHRNPTPESSDSDRPVSVDPIITTQSPSPSQHNTTDSDKDPSENESQVILRSKPHPKTTPTEEDGHTSDDYENIDAHVEEIRKENARRSNYINCPLIDSDEETNYSRPGALNHERYAPSIKLDRHPALKKSQSNADLPDFLKKRPKNKAPPPPPGKTTRGKVGVVLGGASNGHKRSQSDFHLAGNAEETPKQESPRLLTRPPTSQHHPAGQKKGVAPVNKHKSSDQIGRMNKVYDHSPSSSKGRTSPKEPAGVRPKRHAPPPPKQTTPILNRSADALPEYAVVNKQRNTAEQSHRLSGTSSSSSDVAPPKPLRTRRTKSVEDLTSSSQTSLVQMERPMSILDTMDSFTIDLHKDSDASYGLVIVTGKIRDASGETVLEGVFIQRVVPSSPAFHDGRVQAGDMLIEVGGHTMVGGALDDTIELLKAANQSIRLKIGRPDSGCSKFAVEGDSGEPIYENESFSNDDLLQKLSQAEDAILDIQSERDIALNELRTLREQVQNERFKFTDEIQSLQQELEETRAQEKSNSTELTQALASVTIGKTKAESELGSLKSEIEDLKQKLSEASVGVARAESLHAENEKLKLQLSNEKQQYLQLQQQFESAESEFQTETDQLKQVIQEQQDQIESLKSTLEKLRHTRATPLIATPTQHPLDETYVVASKSNDQSDCSDDAFEEKVPSVAPVPYLEYVPLEGKPPKKPKKVIDESTMECSPEENNDQTVAESSERLEGETSQAIEEPKQDDASSEFDAININTVTLNSSAALHKSHVVKKLGRKKPSRAYLRTMGSSNTLLDTTTTSSDAEQTPPVHDKTIDAEIKTPEVVKSVENTPTANIERSNVSEQSPEVPVETPKPKPRPRPRLRPTPSVDDKKPPVAPPRHREVEVVRQKTPEREIPQVVETESPKRPVRETSSNEQENRHVRESPSSDREIPHTRESPKRQFRPSPPQELKKPLIPNKAPLSKQDSNSATSSPLMKKKEPLLPSPKPSPKHTPKHKVLPPLPRKKSWDNSIDSISDAPSDHSSGQLSINTTHNSSSISIDNISDNGLLAAESAPLRQSSAPGTPTKAKKPPPVSRKPKPDHNESESETRRRSKSFDREIEASDSPKPVRKLPAGAINIMGFLPVQNRDIVNESPESRERSCTVSTTEPGAHERNTLKRQIIQHEEELTEDSDPKKIPPKRPPPPKKVSSNGDQFDGIDFGQVLLWEPEIVGMWISRIGLGSYERVFVERGVCGDVLFDFDGHALKGFGMDSHDDRSLFKKEVKVLKPYAEKQRKLLEKQKKDEKKQAKKKKK